MSQTSVPRSSSPLPSLPSSPSPEMPGVVESPPRNFVGIVRHLGPGLIIAASIVGSGELIGTTKTGAEAGFWLLWLIIIGCVIKVFVQVEFGRFTISEGRGTMEIMNQVPGPRLRASWLVWFWCLLLLASMGQLGGILGGVGQAMALAVPFTGDFRAAVDSGLSIAKIYTWDDVAWSTMVAVATSAMLVYGRYRLVERISTFLVVSFTLITLFNVCAIPYVAPGSVGWEQVREGLSFRLPPLREGVTSPLATALATFGIIGVGATEIIAYPYWCLEKGYARYAGPRDDSADWAERARGWLRVMRCDAWCSMAIYTFATLAFYVLGAAVLHPRGLNPGGNQLITTLAEMYSDVFGSWGNYVFLYGAFAVLYSTFFTAIAGNMRVAADGLRTTDLGARTHDTRRWWVRWLCGIAPLVCLGIYMISKDPVTLILISGMTQATMLPMLGGTALYARYRRCDRRILPGKIWDGFLWLSVAGLAVAGVWNLITQISKLL